MKKYLKEYVEYMDELLESDIKDIDREIDKHLIKIEFYQHERLIHLLVTLAYAIMAIISFIASTTTPMFVFVGIILVLFLIPYVLHYFFLENNVQYLYKQYDKLLELKGEK